MQAIAIMMIIGVSFVAGIVTFLAYLLYRMMSNPGWDDSNITNALRLLTHVALHPEDFGKMYYLSSEQVLVIKTNSIYTDKDLRRPFWYVSEDELSEVVKTRPAE